MSFLLTIADPLIQPRHKRVDLEGEAPPLGLVVVELEQVDLSLLADVLPFGQWLVEDGELGEVFAYYPEDS